MNIKNQALHLLFNSQIYPGLVERNANQIKLILFRNDTLGNYITWSLFEAEGTYFVRRIIWKQRQLYNLSDPETYAKEIGISENIFNQILILFSEINWGLLESSPFSVSIDGAVCGVILQGSKIEKILPTQSRYFSDGLVGS